MGHEVSNLQIVQKREKDGDGESKRHEKETERQRQRKGDRDENRKKWSEIWVKNIQEFLVLCLNTFCNTEIIYKFKKTQNIQNKYMVI